VTALSNPKDILFFAAFFPQFIQITSDVGLSLGLLSIIWVAIDLGVLSFYILAIRRWLAPAHTHRLTTIAACFLLILGVYGVGIISGCWQSLALSRRRGSGLMGCDQNQRIDAVFTAQSGGTARRSNVDGNSMVRRRAGESLRRVMKRRLIQ
jgi:hypothetical protein